MRPDPPSTALLLVSFDTDWRFGSEHSRHIAARAARARRRAAPRRDRLAVGARLLPHGHPRLPRGGGGPAQRLSPATHSATSALKRSGSSHIGQWPLSSKTCSSLDGRCSASQVPDACLMTPSSVPHTSRCGSVSDGMTGRRSRSVWSARMTAPGVRVDAADRVDHRRLLRRGGQRLEHLAHEVGEEAAEVRLRGLQVGPELQRRDHAVRPVGLREVGRALGDDHDAREPRVLGELPLVLPGHERPHRPAQEHRVVELEVLDERADVARVLGDAVAALARRRRAVPAEVERDDAVAGRRARRCCARRSGATCRRRAGARAGVPEPTSVTATVAPVESPIRFSVIPVPSLTVTIAVQAQDEVLGAAREVAAEIAPRADLHDREGSFSQENIDALWRAGHREPQPPRGPRRAGREPAHDRRRGARPSPRATPPPRSSG